MSIGSTAGITSAGRAVAGRASYVLLHNTSEVVTPDAEGRRVVRIPRGALVFRDGRVLEIGPGPELSRRHVDARPINAGGRLVTPGLVDCHTHMIFAGQRALEFQRRLRGEDYAAIAGESPGKAAPSGIRATPRSRDRVRANRNGIRGLYGSCRRAVDGRSHPVHVR